MKRLAAVAAIAAVAAVTLSACGSSGGGEQTGSATEGSINWWGWTPDTSVAEKYIAAFNEEYPDIEVTYRNFENGDYKAALRAGLQSNSGPDVFDIALGGDVADFGTFGDFGLDLRPALEEQLGDDWEDDFTFSNDGLTREDGSVAGVSMGGVAAGMIWINQSMFDELGAKVPTNYDEWVAACDIFAAAGKDCLAMGVIPGRSFAMETWRSIVSTIEPGLWYSALQGDASWDDPAFEEGLEVLAQMKEDGIIRDDVTGLAQYPDANNAFLSEQAAMVQMGTWYAQYSKEDSAIASMEAAGVTDPTPFVQLPIPFPEVGGNPATLFGELDYGLSVNARSNATAPATTFALWLTATEQGSQIIANAIDLIPGFVGVEPQWDDLGLVAPDVQIPAIQTMYADAAASDESRNQLVTPALAQAFDVAVASVLEGSTTPADAIATLVSSTQG
ncbi:ABC transporter substrate-binding protein [Microbacterium pygmaeum]|uniref:ABC transporter substrate-binding protein n=1 Tax=Microbacterium pygmaeum TaxID=370764 RepID=UPI0012FBC814|nr:extracellular solute-binding protein [Microbacterium pygmaeum]